MVWKLIKAAVVLWLLRWLGRLVVDPGPVLLALSRHHSF